MMRRIAFVALASALLTTVALASTDTKLVSLLDPQTRVMAGFNAHAIKASPFGQHLLAESAQADFSRFIASTGFDPRTNLYEVLFGSSSIDSASHRVLLVKGRFSPAQVLAFAATKGATTNSYRNISVAEFPATQNKTGKQLGPRWLAFLTPRKAAFGTPESVQHAIDRYLDDTPPDPGLSAQIATASSQFDAWYVSTIPGPELALALPQSSNELTGLTATALQVVQSESFGVKFGSGASVQGQASTSSNEEALSLADRIRYIISVAATQASQKQKPILASLIQNVSVTTQGAAVDWSIQIPESQLERLTRFDGARQGGH